MTRVLVSGGSGLVGKMLCEKLQAKGYDIAILSRTKKNSTAFKTYLWHPDKHQIDPEAIQSSDYIIHLAGANIAEKRWTNSRKKLILDSRVQSANLIFNELKKQKKELKAFISASAVGYYGALTSDTIFTEEHSASDDFLGQTCLAWEHAAKQFEEIGIRTVVLRTGVVLDKQAGALSKMILPVKIGLGSAIGNGRQYMPWIHIDDLCELYIKSIEDNHMNGVFNAVTPDFQTNKSFTQTLAKTLQKPFFLPNIPVFLLRLALGEMSIILLQGSRVSADKLIELGFTFKFPNLGSALKGLLK